MYKGVRQDLQKLALSFMQGDAQDIDPARTPDYATRNSGYAATAKMREEQLEAQI